MKGSLSGKDTPGTNMTTPRDHHGAVLLPPGQVFVTGGTNQGAALLSSELYR